MIVTKVSESDGGVKFRSKNYICGLVLNEIQINDDYKIPVMCQNQVRILVSRLLLAVLSPELASMMKEADTDDLAIALPDLDAEQLQLLLDYALDGRIDRLGREEEILRAFDGYFWDSGLSKEHIKKEDEMAACDNLDKDIKREDEENFINVDEGVARILKCDVIVKNLSSDIVNELKIPNKDSILKRQNSMEETPDMLSKDESNSYEYKRIKIVDFGPQDKEDEDLVVDCLQYTDDESEQKVQLEREEYKKDTGNGSQREVSQNSSEVKQCRKLKSKKNSRHVGGTRGGVVISPDCQLIQDQDTDFTVSQERLRHELEDPNNVEDPCLQWYTHHQLDPNIMRMRNQVKQPPLVCPVCYFHVAPQNDQGSYGTRQTSFFEHMRRHKYNNYTCPCKPHDGDGTGVADHIKLDHWGWKRCSSCPRIIDPLQEATHMWCSHKKNIVCQVCGQVVVYSGYPNHNDMHILKRPCEFCNKTFSSASKREYHVQVVHKKEKLGCNKCYFLCSSISELVKHKESHKEAGEAEDKTAAPAARAVCDICGISVTKNGYNHHYKRHDNTTVECKICGKSMKKYQLTAHMGTHKRGVCTICGKEVGHLCLKSHMKTFHTPLDQLKNKCDICKKGFPTVTALNSHNMNVHLKLRPYKCRYECEFAYNDGSNRNQHEKKKHGQIYTARENKDGIETS